MPAIRSGKPSSPITRSSSAQPSPAHRPDIINSMWPRLPQKQAMASPQVLQIAIGLHTPLARLILTLLARSSPSRMDDRCPASGTCSPSLRDVLAQAVPTKGLFRRVSETLATWATWETWENCGTCGTQSSASAQRSAEPLRCCRSPGCPPTATGHGPQPSFQGSLPVLPGPVCLQSPAQSPVSKLQSRSSKSPASLRSVSSPAQPTPRIVSAPWHRSSTVTVLACDVAKPGFSKPSPSESPELSSKLLRHTLTLFSKKLD
ncbi:hypothetical protein G7Z17_g11624 [Cylindrodendrum hubeiense]|uniref:Uncharacterized protein n=1 Tax=Cylindrodendrum hubeiense TaxID=595255 RepID=A0A9P5GX50_9HYPO|nr:hypothetical protein G7Z17_g11624 [Cylindrodendrum hubeiense]